MTTYGEVSVEEYRTYRGQCRQMCDAAIQADPTLTLVCGWYHCPFNGKEQHWWTVRPDGTIFDPTAAQFPSKGRGEYEVYTGWLECSNCHKAIHESKAQIDGRHAYCSTKCYAQFVGVDYD